MATDLDWMRHAVNQAARGEAEGNLPIGAVLVSGGDLLGEGYNRITLGPTRHAEIDCIDNAGRLSGAAYAASTLYTTLSPCQMCAGAVVLYGIPRVVVGENRTWETSEQWLRDQGVEVAVLDLDACRLPLVDLIARRPDLWPWQ